MKEGWIAHFAGMDFSLTGDRGIERELPGKKLTTPFNGAATEETVEPAKVWLRSYYTVFRQQENGFD